jgi:hypothetical protein
MSSSSFSAALPVSHMVDLTVRYCKLESELQLASQEASAAREGQEHYRRLGSAQYASAKQAMCQVAEVYLEEGRQQAAAMMEQEQQLVSRCGGVLVSEARAYQTALHQGNEAVAQLQQEAALVHWIKQRADEAFSHEHVVCQRLQIELAQSAMAIAHHENHANMIESRCVRYRDQRDAALRECDLCENLARDANHLATKRYDMYRDIGTRYVALQDHFLGLRSLHEARSEATEVRSMQEATVYMRLSSELESATLTEAQVRASLLSRAAGLPPPGRFPQPM